MGFLAEVKMADDGMFEEMKDRISQEHNQRRLGTDRVDALGHQLDEHEGENEPRAQGEEVLLHGAGPLLLEDDQRTAEEFRCRGKTAEDDDQPGHAHTLPSPSIRLLYKGAGLRV